MIILSLDSVGQGCTVCVWQDGALLSFCEEKMTRGQDARLIPMVQSVIKDAAIEYSTLDRVAVTRGPGSFTGLRIGLSAARGIGFAASKPVIGIDRFSIHRAQYPDDDLLVALESRRADLFTKLYHADGTCDEPVLLEIDAMDTVVARAGDVEGCLPLIEAEAITAAALAAKTTIGEAANLPRPLYLRAPDVTMPKCAS